MLKRHRSCYGEFDNSLVSYAKIYELIESVCRKFGKLDGIIFYGSLVSGFLSQDSDIDTIAIVKYTKKPKRISVKMNNIPVTVYIISTKDIIEDGASGKYGGYFIGKLVCPHLVYYNSMNLGIKLETALGFYYKTLQRVFCDIPSLSIDNERPLDNILNWMKYIIPWHDYYIQKIKRSDGSFHIQALMNRHLENCVEKAVESGCGTELNLEGAENFRKRLAVRFWGVGTALHGADYQWPEKYIAGAREKVVR